VSFPWALVLAALETRVHARDEKMPDEPWQLVEASRKVAGALERRPLGHYPGLSARLDQGPRMFRPSRWHRASMPACAPAGILAK
jgi:hypothetical protein